LLGTTALLLSIGAGSFFAATRASLPVEAGRRIAPGLSKPAVIGFDALGVPHIVAASREDAFLALGYATARDRLFQMDLFRRKSAGRLAEIFGAGLVEDDSWSRRMGFARLADAILARLPAAQRAALTSYAAGVNRAISDARVLPWEFLVAGYAPEPWRPHDSLLVALGLATLSYAPEQQRTASVMRAVLPPAVTRFLTPDSDCYNETLVVAAPERCAENAEPPAELGVIMRGATDGRVETPRSQNLFPRGSNGWLVAPKRTRDGRAILANDMHLPLDLPNIWYQADLFYGGRRVEGLTLPGLPMVIAGSNGHVAWGMTSVDGNFADLIRLRMDPIDAKRYATPSGAQDVAFRNERIEVRGAEPVMLRIAETIWGPVLPEPLLGESVAVHWTMLDPDATNLDLIEMDGARSTREALPLLQGAGTPPLNGLVADHEGSIAWTLMGRIPKRRGLNGPFAEDWSDGGVGWDGYVARAETPTIVDPPSGFIVSANQRMVARNEFVYPLSHDYTGGFRAWRIAERLREMDRTDIAESVALQIDTRTEFYRYYQTLALRVLKASSDDRAAALLRAVEAWDGRAEIDSRGLALLVALRDTLVSDILAPVVELCRRAEPRFVYDWSNVDVPLRRIIDSNRRDLLPATAQASDWADFLRAELMKSARNLEAAQGAGAHEARWGDVNRVEIAHPLAAAAAGAARLLSMPRSPLAGCAQCVRHSFTANGKSSGANARMALSPGRETDGAMQMALGQSGQLGSDHYADRQADWVLGRSHPFRMTPIHELTLVPEPLAAAETTKITSGGSR
jgi:penicillin amidase